MAGVFSLLVALAVSIIVNRIATMALMFTGLSREAAKFQARSAFTGVGYTTREAESLVNHPVRRQIVMLLMLLGNIGIATVMATVIVSLGGVGTSTWQSQLFQFAMLSVGIFLLWMAARSRMIERQLNKLIAWALKRFTRLDARDYVELLQLADGYAVTEMLVEHEHWLTGGTLSELRLSDEGLLVLGIHHRDGHYDGIPTADDLIQVGDTIILYGSVNSIQALDRRRSGASGDAEHRKSVKRLQQVIEAGDEEEAADEQTLKS